MLRILLPMIVTRIVIVPSLFLLILLGLSSHFEMSAILIIFCASLMLLVSYLLVAFSLNMVILAGLLIISLPLMR